MEAALKSLIPTLHSALESLRGPLMPELSASLHDPNRLPDKACSDLAAEVGNLLQDIQQLLRPPAEVLAESFLGYVDTKCLWTAVTLKVPDLLAERPKTVADIAEQCNANPDRLRQILRLLHNQGIFNFNASANVYSNSPASELLLRDHWTQWWRWTDLYGNEFYDMAQGIPESIRSGQQRTSAQIHYNNDKALPDQFRDTGGLSKLIGTIGAGAVAQAPGMMEDYAWAEIADETVLDVGGGSGAFLAYLLREHPNMKGAILDLESVIDYNHGFFRTPGGQFADVGDRLVDLIAGDFLKEIPPFQIYTMKWCLHDWDDDKVVLILKNIRSAIIEGPKSRLVIIEAVMSEGQKGRLARLGDIIMMVAAGGKERDEQEWENVAESAGWRIAGVSQLRNAWACAIDLRPV